MTATYAIPDQIVTTPFSKTKMENQDKDGTQKLQKLKRFGSVDNKAANRVQSKPLRPLNL